MESHFFNDKNISNLTALLIKQLNIKDDPEIKKKCKKLVHQQMKEVYEKYGNKRPDGMKSADFLNALNKKSVKQSVVICEESKNKKKQNKESKESNLADLKKERDDMMFNARNIKQPPRRPESPNKSSDNREMLFNDTSNMSNFASFDNKEPGGYIRADGSLAREPIPEDWNTDSVNNDRNKKDDLEMAMKKREQDYDQNYRTNQRGDGPMARGRGGGNDRPDYRDDRGQFNNSNRRNDDFGRNNNFGRNDDFGRDDGFGRDHDNFGRNNDNYGRNNDNYGNNDGFGRDHDNFGGNDELDNNYSNNDGNYGNFGSGYDDNNYNNTEHFDNGEVKDKFNDALASRRALDNVKPPQSKKFNPAVSPYQSNFENDYDQDQNNQRQQQNGRGDQRPINNSNNPLSPNYNNSNMGQGRDSRPNPNQNYDQNRDFSRDLNDSRRDNRNSNRDSRPNPNSNRDYDSRTNNTHLNEYREVLSPLYNNNISKEEMINLDSEQLDAYITKMKNKISTQINLSNFDPNCLQNLNSTELKELINKISLDLSGINNIIDNTSHNNFYPSTFQTHNNEQNNNGTIVNTVKEIEHKNKHIDMANPHKNKYIDVLIKSNEHDLPENYNDYMVEFKQPYTNVTSFQLLNLKLPPISNIITIDNNNVKILLNDNEINKNITPNMYDLPTLINTINVFLTPYFNVSFSNERITIQNITNTKFDLSNGDKSIFRVLGFKKNNYIDKVSYISEEEPLFGSNKDVYLFVEGIKDEEAIFKFKSMENPNSLCPVTLTLDEPIEELSEIFIKFKYENNIESNKNVNFYGKSHEMVVRLGQ